jgi:hypothetical protein
MLNFITKLIIGKEKFYLILIFSLKKQIAGSKGFGIFFVFKLLVVIKLIQKRRFFSGSRP